MYDRYRNETFVNVPRNVTSQTELTSVQDMHKALTRSLQGHNYGVYCSYSGSLYCVYDARTYQGGLQVQVVPHYWVKPDCVYVEG